MDRCPICRTRHAASSAGAGGRPRRLHPRRPQGALAMKQAGQFVLTPFPYTDLSGAKLRPVLMLRQASARFDDWLVCMVSSQIQQADAALDEILAPGDSDFAATGLKAPSALRLSRLAVLDGSLLVGSIGAVSGERLLQIRERLGRWVASEG